MTRKHTFQVGGFTCKMSWEEGLLTAEWDPGAPDEAYFSGIGRKRSDEFWSQYKRGRGKFMQSVADETGAAVCVADVGRNGISTLSTFNPFIVFGAEKPS